MGLKATPRVLPGTPKGELQTGDQRSKRITRNMSCLRELKVHQPLKDTVSKPGECLDLKLGVGQRRVDQKVHRIGGLSVVELVDQHRVLCDVAASCIPEGMRNE